MKIFDNQDAALDYMQAKVERMKCYYLLVKGTEFIVKEPADTFSIHNREWKVLAFTFNWGGEIRGYSTGKLYRPTREEKQ